MSDLAKQSQSNSKAAEELQASFYDLYSHFISFRLAVYRMFSEVYLKLTSDESKASQKAFESWADEVSKTSTYKLVTHAPVRMVLYTVDLLDKDDEASRSIPDVADSWLTALLDLPECDLLVAVDEWETALPKLLSPWNRAPKDNVRGADSWAVTGITKGESFAVTFNSGQLGPSVKACLEKMDIFWAKWSDRNRDLHRAMPKSVDEFSTAAVKGSFEQVLNRYEKDVQVKRKIESDASTSRSPLRYLLRLSEGSLPSTTVLLLLSFPAR